jgi:diketogulonate reductase-like aldo/keto reductase
VFPPWHPTTVDDDPVLAEICSRYHATRSQIALAWLLRRSRSRLPTPGTSSRTHFDENLAAAAIGLAGEDVEIITNSRPDTVSFGCPMAASHSPIERMISHPQNERSSADTGVGSIQPGADSRA